MKGSLLLAVLCCTIAGCHILGDEGEWLGADIADAAQKLRASDRTELVMSYAPVAGADQRYTVGMGRSVWCPTPPCYENLGALTVSVEHGRHGSTTYHERFVAVPTPLSITKVNERTEIVLRKNGEQIEVVALR